MGSSHITNPAAPLMLINYILQNKDASVVVENGLTEDFFPNCKNEFNFIKEHIDNYGQVPDKTTFSVMFPDFTLYHTDESKEFLLDETANYAKWSYVAEKTNKIVKASSSSNIDDVMDIVLEPIPEFEAYKMRPVSLFKDKSRFDSFVQRKEHVNEFLVDTGFAELNELIGGWDRKDELGVIMARTGVGKTWFLLKAAVAACKKGLRVGFYSGEMSVEKVGNRVDTLVSNISNKAIKMGNASVANDYKRYTDTMATLFPGEFLVITPQILGRQPTVSDFASFIKKEKLEILFIDQLSLVEDQRHAKADFEQAANVSRDLKNLQVLSRIPIISVSQQNRPSADKDAGSQHVSRSDRIGQDATTIISIKRGEDDKNEYILNIVKSRDSISDGSIHYHVDLDKGRFQYLPQEDDAFGGNHVSSEMDVDLEELMQEDDVF